MRASISILGIVIGALTLVCSQAPAPPPVGSNGGSPPPAPPGGAADSGPRDAGSPFLPPETGSACPVAVSCTFGDGCENSPCTCYPQADGGNEPRCCVLGGHSGCLLDTDCCNTLGCDAGSCMCLGAGKTCHFNNGCCSYKCDGGGSYTATGVCE